MFTSLFNLVGQSLGLGVGRDGACHLIKIGVEDLLPRDVESGLLNVDYHVFAYDYGNHVGFVVKLGDTPYDGIECTCYTYDQLVSFLRSQIKPPVVEEDAKVDAAIETMREEAMRELEIDPENDDDYESDEGYGEDVEVGGSAGEDDVEEVAEDEEDAVDEDTEDADDKPFVMTLQKPSGKPGSAKYKKALQEMASEMLSYIEDVPEEMIEVLPEVLGEAFKEFDSFEYDTSEDLLEFFSDYIQFE